MQNMIVTVCSHVMFYYHTVCPYLFVLYIILTLHLNVPDNNDNISVNTSLVTTACMHAAFHKVL